MEPFYLGSMLGPLIFGKSHIYIYTHVYIYMYIPRVTVVCVFLGGGLGTFFLDVQGKKRTFSQKKDMRQ